MPLIYMILAAMIMSYIPKISILGFALTLYIYHTFLKHRNIYIASAIHLLSAKNENIPSNIKPATLRLIFRYALSFIIMYLMTTKIYYYIENEIKDIPTFDIFLFIGAFVLLWISYASLVNALSKDVWSVQEILKNLGIVKTNYMKYRDGHFVMAMRMITLNIYEWYFLVTYANELSKSYMYIDLELKLKKALENYQKEKEKDIFEELKERIEKIENEEEKLSIIFSVLSTLSKEKFEEVGEKLVENGIITQEELENIKSKIRY